MALKFKTKKSRIDGFGIFCTQFIPKGELICKMVGQEISVNELKRRYASGREESTNPLQVSDNRYLDLRRPYLYINHSCNPNSALVRRNDLIAIRDIKIGEEITFNYSAADWPNQKYWRDYPDLWTMSCNCGAITCRKVIRSWLFMPQRLQKLYINNKYVPNFIMQKHQENKEILKEKDKSSYVLSEGRDLNILNMIYNLKKYRLSVEDKKLVQVIKSQLKKDWRNELIKILVSLNRKYKNSNGQ